MDILVVTGYASGCSEYNPIERLWAFLSYQVDGLSLEAKSPNSTTKHPVHSETQEIYDFQTQELCRYWNNKEYNSFPVKAIAVTCTQCKSVQAEYDRVYSFSHATVGQLLGTVVEDDSEESSDATNMCNDEDNEYTENNKTSETLGEPVPTQDWESFKTLFQIIIRHCEKRENVLSFIRCNNSSCNHCCKLPSDHTPLFDCLATRFSGRIPCPVQTDPDSQHYRTFLEMEASHWSPKDPLPSELGAFGLCYVHRYYYSNKQDKIRHLRYAHKCIPPLPCGFLFDNGMKQDIKLLLLRDDVSIRIQQRTRLKGPPT